MSLIYFLPLTHFNISATFVNYTPKQNLLEIEQYFDLINVKVNSSAHLLNRDISSSQNLAGGLVG
jgi:hypothetical protein